ncbi:MAG: hypothetical protein ABJA82_17750 [Myxococcales bacterium]
MDAFVKLGRASGWVGMGYFFALSCAQAESPSPSAPQGGGSTGGRAPTGTGGVLGTGGLTGAGGSTVNGGATGSGSDSTRGGGPGGGSQKGQEGIGGVPGSGGANQAGMAGSGQGSGEFRALTYNVAGLPEGLSGSEPSMNTQYISPLLNDYALVMVQEDWKEPNPNILALLGYHVYHNILAKEAKHPYQSIPKPIPVLTDLTRPTALVSDGLNFFSNFPFQEPVTRVRWTNCFGDAKVGAADCLAQKGFAMAAFEFAPGIKIDVYTLHAEAGSTEMDQSLQVADYQQLSAYILANSAGHAVILGGDTNLHLEDPADLMIWNGFLQSTGLMEMCKTFACPTADNLEVDKFAYHGNASLTITPLMYAFPRSRFVRPTDGKPLSDHPPLEMRFRWAAKN